MTTSKTTKELFSALAKAQGQIENASKDNTNPFFKSKYADLASVWKAIRGPLSANGLALIQSTETIFEAVPVLIDGESYLPVMVKIHSLLAHESGESIESDLHLRAMESTPQAIGSAITYGRRYEAMALCGVAPADDDGNSASEGPAPRPVPAKNNPQPAALKPAPKGLPTEKANDDELPF